MVIKQFKTRLVGLQVIIIVIIRYISGNITFREPSSRAISAQYGVLALASLGPIHAVLGRNRPALGLSKSHVALLNRIIVIILL